MNIHLIHVTVWILVVIGSYLAVHIYAKIPAARDFFLILSVVGAFSLKEVAEILPANQMDFARLLVIALLLGGAAAVVSVRWRMYEQ